MSETLEDRSRGMQLSYKCQVSHLCCVKLYLLVTIHYSKGTINSRNRCLLAGSSLTFHCNSGVTSSPGTSTSTMPLPTTKMSTWKEISSIVYEEETSTVWSSPIVTITTLRHTPKRLSTPGATTPGGVTSLQTSDTLVVTQDSGDTGVDGLFVVYLHPLRFIFLMIISRAWICVCARDFLGVCVSCVQFMVSYYESKHLPLQRASLSIIICLFCHQRPPVTLSPACVLASSCSSLQLSALFSSSGKVLSDVTSYDFFLNQKTN